jgi:uncharacterized protein YndB with AHSA1/START domain
MIANILCRHRLCHVVAGAALAALVITSGKASAELTDTSPEGFSVVERAHVSAPSDKVYAALITPQHWWSGKHTFSGDAANLTLEAKAGGCWCEAMPDGGSVEHMSVVFVSPGKTLRLRGAMGPFQEMATVTVMTWSLKPAGDGTDVTLTSSTGGYTKGGLESIAPIVDRVFGEQINRLKSYVETGAPSAPVKEAKP